MRDNIRVAIMQPKPYPSFDDPRNIGHALTLLERCRGEKLDVICFPEYFPYLGEDELASAAERHGAYLVAGLVESEGEKLFNTATLFDRSGKIVGRQRKRNIGSLEREHLGISAGDDLYRAYVTDFGKIGIPVCADFWGEGGAGKQLVDQGADVIINIGLFPVLRGHWKTAAMVRACENFVPVVGVNCADYNAMIHGRRVHQHGGGSFALQPPKMIDKDDFRRWFKGLDNFQDWVRVELDELEQTHIVDVNLSVARRFRREFWSRLGIQR